MVVRKRRGALLSEHPVMMTRFDLSEWPGEPLEAFAAWRVEYLDYWHDRHHPGGLYALLATMQAGRRLVATGEVVDIDVLAREKSEPRYLTTARNRA